MAEVARLAVVLAVPVVGQLDQRSIAAVALALLDARFVLRCGQKHQGVAILVVDPAAGLLEAELFAVEMGGLIKVGDGQEGVQISHGCDLFTSSGKKADESKHT